MLNKQMPNYKTKALSGIGFMTLQALLIGLFDIGLLYNHYDLSTYPC